jgi:hypothetical protein
MIPLGAERLILRRATGPTTSDGHGGAVPASTTDISIWCSFQAMSSHQMQNLPAGDRERDAHWGSTDYPDVRTVSQYDGTPPDLLVRNGITYQIRSVDDYPAAAPIGHCEMVFLRVQETSPGATP